jgi:hypothetical protein
MAFAGSREGFSEAPAKDPWESLTGPVAGREGFSDGRRPRCQK